MVPNRLSTQHLRVPIHSLVLLLPQHTKSECTHKPNLDMGTTAVNPPLQHTMVRYPLMHAWGHKLTMAKYYVTVVFLVYSMCSICAGVWQFNSYVILQQLFWVPHSKDAIGACSDKLYIPQSGKCITSLAAVGAPQGVSLERLILQGAVRVTWSPPTDLCGLNNPQYTIQYGKTKSTLTTHPSKPSSSPFDITGLEVGQEYFVRVAVRKQSGSGNFSSWESVTPCKGVTICHCICYSKL